MWFKMVLLVLSLSLLGLGAAQQCEGFVGVLGMTPDQLKKEIRANVAAALREGVVMNSGNGTWVGSNQKEQNATLEKAVLEKIVDTAIERRLAAAMEEVIVNISNSFEHLVSPIRIEMNKCNANIQDVDGALEKFNSTMEKMVDTAVERRLATVVEDVVANISNSFEELLTPIMTKLDLLRYPGSTPSHPAASCKEIKELSPTAPSGYYWLRGTGDSSVHMYCDMSRSCEGITGGWMRVTRLNMTNSSHTCPAGLKLLTTPKRLCAMNIDGSGCSSATFNLHGIRYTHVCGKIIGYQQKTPDAFWAYYNNRRLKIDDTYVDGISLTHGRNPRKHIWTFVAALHEVLSRYITDHYTLCPCTNIHNTVTIPIPPYVGSDYFCDTASESHYQYIFYPNDPLWDGQGCGRLNTCCAFNNPPWFMKELPSSTSDDIEMRLCADEARSREDINFETVELYVR